MGDVLWPIVAFVLGSIFGVLTAIASFRSALAVAEHRIGEAEKAAKEMRTELTALAKEMHEGFRSLAVRIGDVAGRLGADRRQGERVSESGRGPAYIPHGEG